MEVLSAMENFHQQADKRWQAALLRESHPGKRCHLAQKCLSSLMDGPLCVDALPVFHLRGDNDNTTFAVAAGTSYCSIVLFTIQLNFFFNKLMIFPNREK